MSNNRERRHAAEQTVAQQQSRDRTSGPSADKSREFDHHQETDKLQVKIEAHQAQKVAWADGERARLTAQHREMGQELREGPAQNVQAVSRALEQFAQQQRQAVEIFKNAVDGAVAPQQQELADQREQQQRRVDMINAVLASMTQDKQQADAFRADQNQRMAAELNKVAQYHQELSRMQERFQGQLTSMLGEQRAAFLEAAQRALRGEEQGPTLAGVLEAQAKELGQFRRETQERVRELTAAFERAKEYGVVLPHQDQQYAKWTEDRQLLTTNAHILARGIANRITVDPNSGRSAFEDRQYKESVTLRLLREIEDVIKRKDDKVMQRFDREQRQGAISERTIELASVEAAVQRTIEARDRVMRHLVEQGNWQRLDDLLKITDRKIIEAAVLQQSELFADSHEHKQREDEYKERERQERERQEREQQQREQRERDDLR
jgi:hypothetical protein